MRSAIGLSLSSSSGWSGWIRTPYLLRDMVMVMGRLK
jgi:hypothetical protein